LHIVATVSGLPVSPWGGAEEMELHVTADVSLMMRQYIQLTNDTGFLTRDGGYQAIADIADFWVSRSQFDSSRQQYVINGK
jgi:trehalose/maltose hydrolase-like predicted phosphorylase